jgi:hypothetical protein
VPAGTITGGGREDAVNHGESGGQPLDTPGQCVAAQTSHGSQGASLAVDPTARPPGEPGANVVFKPFRELHFGATCDGVLRNITAVRVWASAVPPDAFDHRFFLPKKATDQGKVIQHVEQTPAQKAACTMRSSATRSCLLDWSGKVTLELVEVMKTGPIDVEGPFPPADPWAPGGCRPVPRRAKLSRGADRASVSITFAGGCAGTVRAYALGARKLLAQRPFHVAGGRTATVRVRFRGAARRAVRRAGGVRLVVDTGTARRSIVARLR